MSCCGSETSQRCRVKRPNRRFAMKLVASSSQEPNRQDFNEIQESEDMLDGATARSHRVCTEGGQLGSRRPEWRRRTARHEAIVIGLQNEETKYKPWPDGRSRERNQRQRKMQLITRAHVRQALVTESILRLATRLVIWRHGMASQRKDETRDFSMASACCPA